MKAAPSPSVKLRAPSSLLENGHFSMSGVAAALVHLIAAAVVRAATPARKIRAIGGDGGAAAGVASSSSRSRVES